MKKGVFFMWYDKRFHSLNYALREHFDCKIIKLSIDGGFTCPNRDGSIAKNGCIFCSEQGSGEFASSSSLSIENQIEEQISLLSTKWPNAKYIAYFQNFTSTYGSVEYLKKIYDSALSCNNVVGLAIATRPDCLSIEVLNLLAEFNKKTFLWIELGLQSIHKSSADFIRRGYSLDVFDNAVNNLNERNIKSVVHIISNLPTESKEDYYSTLKYLNKKPIWGVKIHMLHILKNTDLEKYYLQNPFSLMNQDDYINLIVHSLEILRPDIVIHRITGDGKKEDLIAPRWTLNKRAVLNGVDKLLKSSDSYQGKLYNP
jgi:radical SAM protein (TIGR01212 family)